MSPDGAAGHAGVAGSESVYHLQLRQFPHNFCHFNLTAQELLATVLGPWSEDRWIELGERKWSPHQAKLIVIEGPRIALEELSMGRGWRTAQRQGRDVTDQMLRAAPAGADAPSGSPSRTSPPSPEPSPNADLLADSLGLELLTRIGSEPAPLRRAWELAAERHPGGTAGEALAVAERAVASLLRGRLIVLLRAAGATGRVDAPGGRAETPGGRAEAPGGGTSAPADAWGSVGEGDAERILGAVESWTGAGEAAGVWMRRV